MILSKRTIVLLLGLGVLISIFVKNDTTVAYFIVVFLSLLSVYFLDIKKMKISFVISSSLLILYSYLVGLFITYAFQDSISNIVSIDRILGYAAAYSLPFVFLSLLSIWFIFKYVKTRKVNWYYGFIFIIVVCTLGDYEGYGTNYLFKTVLLVLNFISFIQLREVIEKKTSQ